MPISDHILDSDCDIEFPLILDFSRVEIGHLIVSLGEPKFRAKQLWRGLYHQIVTSFDEITSLSLSLRKTLNDRFLISAVEPSLTLTSKDKSTTKVLFRLSDGELIETVLMRYPQDGHRKGRKTVCVSTQVGCALGCTFCATGQQGFSRQLTVGEIVSQVLYMEKMARVEDEKEIRVGIRTKGERQGVTNVVFMGMGEPLANYDATLAAVRVLNDEQGIHLGARNITISTVGLIPQILKLAKEELQINLAVSLHASDNPTRDQTVPVNKRYPVNQLIDACRTYIELTNRRIFFEYVLLDGQNDSLKNADNLGTLLEGLMCHVNLIPVNPTSESSFNRPDCERGKEFQNKLSEYSIPSTLRMEKGIDINAGCGQLRTTFMNEIKLNVEKVN